jgi:hypothetical protein
MGLEEAEQAPPLRHLGKPVLIVSHQPAIEGSRADAFDRKQQSHGHDFTGREFGIRAFRDVQHLLVHGAEQCDNEILGSHTVCSSALKAFTHLNCEALYDYLSIRILFVPYKTNTIG